MKNYLKFFLLLGFVVLFFGGVIWLKSNYPQIIPLGGKEEKVATDSGFAKAIAEAQKKAEEERKRIEEEKKFIATYGPCRWIPILMYHHIDDKPGWLYVDPSTFVSQMDYLVGKGYNTVTLPEVTSYLASGQIPGKPVVITFDDGYRDVFNNAYPILRQRNLKATVFLITQLMEGDQYLTWEQARELAGNPLITIGDHSLSHRSLASLSEEQIKDEIVSSKNILESQLGIKVNVFSFPYGGYNQTVGKYLTEAGFVAAVTSQSGYSCAKLPYGLRRIRIGRAPLSNYGL